MEEELNYATVVFKNGGRPAEEKNEDSTIDSTVKSKVPATTVPDGEAPANFPHFRLLVVCLGILCVLLVASISAIIYICVVMNEQRAFTANLSHVKTENEQLIMEKRILENRTEELIVERSILENRTEQLIMEKRILENRTEELIVERSILENRTEELIVERRVLENRTEQLTRDRDDLNWTLRVIMKFDNFPVNDFCPDKKCQPCQNGWILFQENCYLLSDKGWRKWQDSQKYCQTKDANLVVIDSAQEQEFISNRIKFYYDKFHGYWLGLHQNADNDWIWVDGRNDTVWYWMTQKFTDSRPCVMINPSGNPTANWDKKKCFMRNKFICESEALIRTPVT